MVKNERRTKIKTKLTDTDTRHTSHMYTRLFINRKSNKAIVYYATLLNEFYFPFIFKTVVSCVFRIFLSLSLFLSLLHIIRKLSLVVCCCRSFFYSSHSIKCSTVNLYIVLDREQMIRTISLILVVIK